MRKVLGMEITTTEDSGITILSLKGPLNIKVASEVKARLGKILEQGPVKLVCDLKGVNYMDSAGMGVLVFGLKESMATGGRFAICNLDTTIDELFKLAKLDKIIPSYIDLADAKKDLAG